MLPRSDASCDQLSDWLTGNDQRLLKGQLQTTYIYSLAITYIDLIQNNVIFLSTLTSIGEF